MTVFTDELFDVNARKESDMRANESFGGKKKVRKILIFFFFFLLITINICDRIKKKEKRKRNSTRKVSRVRQICRVYSLHNKRRNE